MLSDDAVELAAELIGRAAETLKPMQHLGPGLRPTTREEGYAIQALLESDAGNPVVGWKIAATNKAGQAHIGVDSPLVGRLLASMVKPDGATISLRGNAMLVAEAEFAFVFGRDLAPREADYTLDEVMAAVATARLGIEVPDSRFASFENAGGPQLIADNACALWYVLGTEIADWRGLDFAAQRVQAKAGTRIHDGIGANVLGDPRLALAWMVNEMTRLGTTLRAGQFVTTGTVTAPLAIARGDTVVADFGALGRVTVHFTA